ncbi:MAG: N-methyl-L-tryptophan oxidase, partial [Vicinamibacterales bacterium]
ARGSSHGTSRVIRLAYFEHPDYVPLLRRAFDLWDRLERDTGRSIIALTGGLMIGRPESDVVSGSLRSAHEHGLDYELLDAREIHRRFPPLTPGPEIVALHEPRAGVVNPEQAIHAHLERAAANGALFCFNERVVDWAAGPDGAGVRVTTTRQTVEARTLVIAPGAWAPSLFKLASVPLEVERQVLYWFNPVAGSLPFSRDRFPIYIWDQGEGVQFYGFPEESAGRVKVAFFRTGGGARCSAEDVERAVHPEEVIAMRAALCSRIPSLAEGDLVDAVTCLYTLTPDHHFVIGLHPDHPQVVIASPCSGHGYKFASVVGEILADLAVDRASRHPIGLFSPDRFARR